MLKSDLPTIQGNRRQLREVILNLVQNSIEAMTGVTGRRIISVVTSRHGANAVSMRDRVFGQRRKGRHYKHEECL